LECISGEKFHHACMVNWVEYETTAKNVLSCATTVVLKSMVMLSEK